MGFFEKSRLKRNYEYSDEEIDNFIQHLRDNNLTIDTEEEAMQFLKLQQNMDPTAIKKEFILDERIKPGKNTAMYRLWANFPEYQNGKDFEPMEYMHENILNAHEILKKNFYLINEPSEKFDDFDENQHDIMQFINYLNERSITILKAKVKGCETPVDQSIEQLEEIKNMIDSSDKNDPEQMMKLLFDDRNMADLGRFDNLEELEDVIKAYMEENKEEPEEHYESPIPIDESRDAEVIIRLSHDKVRAWMYIVPPLNGGQEITAEAIKNAMA